MNLAAITVLAAVFVGRQLRKKAKKNTNATERSLTASHPARSQVKDGDCLALGMAELPCVDCVEGERKSCWEKAVRSPQPVHDSEGGN